jgi:poly(A) polymerase
MLKPAGKLKAQEWMISPETTGLMTVLTGGEAEPKALFVGGCVRNTLLGRAAGDLDIATVWTPEQVTKRLEKAGIKVIPTGIDHGTVTAVHNGRSFEITTLRRDVATDGRRAVVAFTQDWREDAQRRDFTMNTLLADVQGHVYDPTGRGLADLKDGKVVFVGDPKQRIAEDYLRILRFFRFHGWYGRGEMDEAALAACRAAAAKISKLSRERITQEVLRILALNNPVAVLNKMFENKVLTDIPYKKYDSAALSHLCGLQNRHQEVSVMARLAVLAGLNAKHLPKMEKYLVLSNAQKKEFEEILRIFSALEKISDQIVKELIYRNNKSNTIQAVLLFSVKGDVDSNKEVGRMKFWKPPVFPVTGNDVQKLKIEPGPEIGRLLKKTEAWWIENDFRPNRAVCLQKLEEFTK